MKLIIAGGRDFTNSKLMVSEINRLNIDSRISEIVCGGAKGADALGKKLAQINEVPVKDMPAHWARYGKSAGFIRNEEMAEYADALLAFWDGRSKGTKHMINTARKLKLWVTVISYE